MPRFTKGHPCAQPARCDSGGFSLVEVVLAMFVLAVMAIGTLPLILTATRTSATNRSLVAATTFANAQLAELHASFSNDDVRSCAELVSAAAPTPPDPAWPYLRTGFADPTGTGLTADRTAQASPCGGADYDTVGITVTVHPPGNPGRTLVTLTSEIQVSNP